MSTNKQIVKEFQEMKPSMVFKKLDLSKFPKEVREKIKSDLSGISDDALDMQQGQPTFKKWIEMMADHYPAAFGLKVEKVPSLAPSVTPAATKDVSAELEAKINDLETRSGVIKKMILKQPAKRDELRVRLKTVEKMIKKLSDDLKEAKKAQKKISRKKSLGGFLLGAVAGVVAGQFIDLKLRKKSFSYGEGGTIEGDKKFKYSVTYQTVTPESAEDGDYADNGYVIQDEVSELQDILRKAVNDYGINEPSSSGYKDGKRTVTAGCWWSSVTPDHDHDYFTKGIEKYYSLHINNVDGSELNQEETQFIQEKLDSGRKLHWDDEDKEWWKDGGTIHSSDEDGILMFKADTKGGKYSIEVREHTNQLGTSYRVMDFTNGNSRSYGSYNNKEIAIHKIMDSIIGSKKIDGINYKISFDNLYIGENLPVAEKMWDIYNGSEYREWFKKEIDSLPENKKKAIAEELKNKAIKYVKDNGYQENDSTIGTFFQIFRKERLIADFLKSKDVVENKFPKIQDDLTTRSGMSNGGGVEKNKFKEDDFVIGVGQNKYHGDKGQIFGYKDQTGNPIAKGLVIVRMLDNSGLKYIPEENLDFYNPKGVPLSDKMKARLKELFPNEPHHLPKYQEEYESKKGSMSNGGGVDSENLAVDVSGIGNVYRGTSIQEAIAVAKEYMKKNKNFQVRIYDEKYGYQYNLNGNLRIDLSEDSNFYKDTNGVVWSVIKDFGDGNALLENKKNENKKVPIKELIIKYRLTNKYSNGGGVSDKKVDLFEYPELTPPDVQKILEMYQQEFGDSRDYKDTERMLKDIEALGYTFDFYLDNEPYGLRKVGVELNELEGYEEMRKGGKVGKIKKLKQSDIDKNIIDISKKRKSKYSWMAWDNIDYYNSGLKPNSISDESDEDDAINAAHGFVEDDFAFVTVVVDNRKGEIIGRTDGSDFGRNDDDDNNDEMKRGGLFEGDDIRSVKEEVEEGYTFENVKRVFGKPAYVPEKGDRVIPQKWETNDMYRLLSESGDLLKDGFDSKEEVEKYISENELVVVDKIIRKRNGGGVGAIKIKGKGEDVKVYVADKDGKFVFSKTETDKYHKRRNNPMNLISKEKFSSGGGVSDTPKVYIADLAAYNEGKLIGEWVDLSDFSSGEEVMEKISELMEKWSKEQGEEREEYAVHDMENFPKDLYDESMGEEDFQKVIEFWEAVSNSDYPKEVVEEFMALTNDDDFSNAISNMDSAYQGKYSDAADFAEQLIKDIGMPSNPEQYLYVTDTDKRIVAGEQADNDVEDMKDDDILDRADMKEEYEEREKKESDIEMLEEEIYGLDKEDDADEIEEKESELENLKDELNEMDTLEEILANAKEKVHDEIYEEWYDGLDDPLQFLVKELGIYSEEDLMKANFIGFDYEEFAKDLEQDYHIIEDGGKVYVFNQNYRNGGNVKKRRKLAAN